MFKKRELAIELRPKEKDEPKPEKPAMDGKMVDKIYDAAISVIATAAMAVYGYVLLDTRRQVHVAKIMYKNHS